MVSYCIRRCLLSAVSRPVLSTLTTRLSPPWLKQCGSRRFSHTTASAAGAYRLERRGVVRVSGRDTVDLLQGLVTSDLTLFTDGTHSVAAQYSMMLNVQGRVLFDLIIYNQTKDLESVCFLIECDASLKDDFVKAVKRYRIRKKVDIADVSDEYSVWSVPSNLDPSQPLIGQGEGDGQGEGEGKENSTEARDVANAVIAVSDPRVPLFGQRILFKTGEETLTSGGSQEYDSLRYRWGIPEGAADMPPANCLPLESNLTIMNGVSFFKGCYVGQELTARTHHTGVIRKRLLPLVFQSPPPEIDSDSQISTDKGKTAGKLRSVAGEYGLGLVRLEHHSKPFTITAKDGQKVPLTAYRPGWWPEELRT